jgi:hypothetical protein
MWLKLRQARNLGHGGHLPGVPPGEFPHRFAPVLAAFTMS